MSNTPTQHVDKEHINLLNRLRISLPSGSKTFQGRGLKAYSRKNKLQQDHQIKQFAQKTTLTKFGHMCSKLNIDPLHPYSVHLILMMFGRIKNKKKLVELFCQQTKTHNVQLDWNTVTTAGHYDDFTTTEAEPTLGLRQTDLFYALSDWNMILSYLEVTNDTEILEMLMKLPNARRLQQGLEDAGLAEFYNVSPDFIISALLFIMPSSLSTSKMLERYLLNCSDQCKDIEFRCLRALGVYNDTQVDEDAAMRHVLLIMPHVSVKKIFFSDMRTVLMQSNDVVEDNPQQVSRLRLRHVVKQIHAEIPQYMQTFEHWLTQQSFSTTMSKYLQLLLYFVSVQVRKVPEKAYSKYYTRSLLDRFQNIHVQQIDASAVIRVIKGIRVYLHNVKNLLNFRTQCLHGLPQSKRLSLTLAQILQLYVACFQHDSIRIACWKFVVNTWNHTIERDLERFRLKEEFDIAPVLETVVRCQLDDTVLLNTFNDNSACIETECGGETACGESECGETECGETEYGETECGETECGETECDHTDLNETEYAGTECTDTECYKTKCAELNEETACGNTEGHETITNPQTRATSPKDWVINVQEVQEVQVNKEQNANIEVAPDTQTDLETDTDSDSDSDLSSKAEINTNTYKQ